MTEPRRITSADKNYRHGDLSVFPAAMDSRTSLYEASNNAETVLRHSLTMTAQYIIVDDASAFPPQGIIRITGPKGGEAEVVYYGRKIGNQFHLLQRGFAGHRQGPWPAGSIITCPVMSEHHNALKDAIMKIQAKIGGIDPAPETLHANIRTLEQRWLAPKAAFKAFPRLGIPPLTVRFQNFSAGNTSRFLWEFGDGERSTEVSPEHTYVGEGIYTVKLNIVHGTSGAQGFTEKANYIEVTNELRKPFFYAQPIHGLSTDTAMRRGTKPTEFLFVDQTDGDIAERHWFFGDNADLTIDNPNVHVVKHTFNKPGEYKPTLLIRFGNQQLSRANIIETITVI